MIGIMDTRFVCINCGEISILKLLSSTQEMEFIGVEVCKCLGNADSKPKRESNIVSFTLEKEKRFNLKRKK